MRPKNSHRHALASALAISLYLHLSLIAFLAFLVNIKGPNGCRGEDLAMQPFEISLVPLQSETTQLELEKKKKEELKKEEEKERQEEKLINGQVVDIPAPAEERQPEKAKFLSEHDSKVEKETKGPPVPFKPGKIIPDRQMPTPKQSPVQPSDPRKQEEVERKIMKLAMRAEPAVPKSRVEPDMKGDELAKPEKKETPQIQGPSSVQEPQESQKRRLTMNDLRLSDQELNRALGTRANDYLKDIDEGEQTLLNTKRWRFATFFNRVKRQVADNWHPDEVYRRRDPSGNVYGFRDRLTVLQVHLTPEGRLKEVQLEKPCGVGFLDDEAISAFRAAEPFPNPPKGLVDQETGLISFRFGFLFEISRRPGFRIFRYEDE
jgi:TonB family protein